MTHPLLTASWFCRLYSPSLIHVSCDYFSSVKSLAQESVSHGLLLDEAKLRQH